MQDSVDIKAPAKLNLFLRILGQKNNGYHIIRTGITFLDLYDEISISLSDINNLSYSGPFKPPSSIFKNDIIIKILKDISIKQKLNIKIIKNIPWQAGLGSASTDAASLIKGLKKLGLIKDINNSFLSKIGADVPACYYAKNCIATGIGSEILKNIDFPNYFFVLIQPENKLSTSKMYLRIKKYIKFEKNINKISNSNFIHEDDNQNDFEKIIKKENKQISDILIFLSTLKNNIFSRMTGSGSCCYAAFKKKDDAKKAYDITTKKYKDYWINIVKNNTLLS